MENNWIPCKPGHMPEDDKRYEGKKIINVLVTTVTGRVTKVQRCKNGDHWYWGRIYGQPKAWMPLPKPYRETAE